MTNITQYPRQDLFETELASPITAAATTIYVATSPSFALSSGSFYATIDPTGTPEIVEVTAISGTTWTVTRGIALYEGGASSASVHAGGVKILISDNWKNFDAIRSAVATKMDTAGGTFTGSVAFSGSSTYFRLPNLTTAQRTALTAANGMKVYDTDLGAVYTYIGGVWTSEGTSTTANASDHAAGKVDIASASEIAAGTNTDATSGATNVLSVASTKKGSTTGSDENKVPVLDSNGDVDISTIPTGTSQVQLKSTLTAKGDFYVATASGVVTRLAVGSDDKVLVADSSTSEGIKWGYGDKKIIFVPSCEALYSGGAAVVTHIPGGSVAGPGGAISLASASTSSLSFSVSVPRNASSISSIKVAYSQTSPGGGVMRMINQDAYIVRPSDGTVQSDTDGADVSFTTTYSASDVQYWTLASDVYNGLTISASDNLIISFSRDGAAGADTEGIIYVHGILFTFA